MTVVSLKFMRSLVSSSPAAVAVVSAWVCLLGACTESPVETRGLDEGSEQTSAGQRTAEPIAFPERPTQADLLRRRAPLPVRRGAASEPVEVVLEERPQPKRDLPGELRQAFGSASGCLAPGSVSAGGVPASLSVVMSTSGRVTRATVTAPVSRQELRCLRERAEQLALRGPFEDAPKSVTTSIRLIAPSARAQRAANTARALPAGLRRQEWFSRR